MESSGIEFTARKAVEADLVSIVQIHIVAFPEFFLTKMGHSFLKQYYRAYIEKGETLQVVVDSNDRILGFVAGLLDSEGFYKFMKNIWYRFFPSVVVAMVDINLLVNCVQRVFSVFRSNKVNDEVNVPDGFHELTSIAVSPEARQMGVGRILMKTYIDTVKNLSQVRGIMLTTDFHENEKVHRFYKSLGFKVGDDFVQGKKRKMNVYSLILD